MSFECKTQRTMSIIASVVVSRNRDVDAFARSLELCWLPFLNDDRPYGCDAEDSVFAEVKTGVVSKLFDIHGRSMDDDNDAISLHRILCQVYSSGRQVLRLCLYWTRSLISHS